MPLRPRPRPLRAGTVWAVFVIALLLGAAAGWIWRSFSTSPRGALEQRVHDLAAEVKGAAEKATR